MCDGINSTFLTAVISAVAGVCAWVGANFFAEPLLSFYRRRRAIRESMMYAANVDAKRPEVFAIAYEELRRHAAAMDALDETVPTAVRVILSWQGFNMSEAKTGLLGFSNSLATYNDSRENARNRIRKALRFRGEF